MEVFIPMNGGRALFGPFPSEQAAREWWCDHEVHCSGGVEHEGWPEDKFPGVTVRAARRLAVLPPIRCLSPEEIDEAAQNPDNLLGLADSGEAGDLKPIVTMAGGEIVQVAYHPEEIKKARRAVHAKAFLMALLAFIVVFALAVSNPADNWPPAIFVLVPLTAYALTWAACRIPI